MTQKRIHHHDIGYKELFSYPEMVQQLIEGFAPQAIAELLDFSTLKPHNGHYITPTFETQAEDIVWSVKAKLSETETIEVYLYILLEFQSTIDDTMPLRFLNYIANFYSHLYKNSPTKPKQLPPVFPIVLYNGNKKWQAPTRMEQMIYSVPEVLKAYQPHLSFYLIDEGRYTDQELEQIGNPVSAVFSLENASNLNDLKQAIVRLGQIRKNQQSNQQKRMDRLLTRWFKRHLKRVQKDLKISDQEIDHLMEEPEVLAENLEIIRNSLIEEGMEKGMQQGLQKGLQEGLQEGLRKGKIALAKGFILAKFKDANAGEVEALLNQVDEQKLEQIKERIFTAQTLSELFE